MPTAVPQQEAEREALYRLARAVRNTRGMFALFPVESNLYRGRLGAFLGELESDLEHDGITLRRVSLRRDAWNLLAVLEDLPPLQPNEVLLVLGLEDTPGIADEAVSVGAKALWLQPAITSEDAAARARRAG